MRLIELYETNRMSELLLDVDRDILLNSIKNLNSVYLEPYHERKMILMHFDYASPSLNEMLKIAIFYEFKGSEQDYYRRLYYVAHAKNNGNKLPVRGRDKILKYITGNITKKTIKVLTDDRYWDVYKVVVNGVTL